jgi:hypothetical protein
MAGHSVSCTPSPRWIPGHSTLEASRSPPKKHLARYDCIDDPIWLKVIGKARPPQQKGLWRVRVGGPPPRCACNAPAISLILTIMRREYLNLHNATIRGSIAGA